MSTYCINITNITAKSWKRNIDIMKSLYGRVIRMLILSMQIN